MSSGAAAQDDYICAERPLVTVGAVDADIARFTCEAADTGLALLGSCGLELVRPVRIDVADRIDTDHLHCLGQFSCDDDRVELLSPQALAGAVRQDRPTGQIPSERLFETMVAHELTHAALSHATPPGELGVVDHEYLAYSFQIEALSEEEREIFMTLAPGEDEDAAFDRVNGFLLMMSPDHFAAAAYAHFSAPENRCSMVARIVSGEFRFPDLDRY